MSDPATESPPRLWALLVGIDNYQAINGLAGCVNDVTAMSHFLKERLHVPDEQIRLLTNAQATRAEILKAFQDFLIANPAIQRDDPILFHFSGHGSQMPSRHPTELDALDETLVPYDARTPDVWDIPDKTLAALLDQLAAAKGSNITLFLDCCHSGSGTRLVARPGETLPRVRLSPSDTRLPPADLDAEIRAAAQATSAGPSGWSLSGGNYVVLAGCRDKELSREYHGREAGEGWHGAMTYFILQTLNQLDTGTPLSYAQLHEQVAARVSTIYPDQSPQCEGTPAARDRLIFSGVRLPRDPFLLVQGFDRAQRRLTLAAGTIMGIQSGTEVAIYPASTARRDALPPPLGSATVLSVTATSALARVNPTGAMPPESAWAGAKALVTAYTGRRETVALRAASPTAVPALDAVRAAIATATPNGKPSHYLKVLDQPDQPPTLWVIGEGDELTICAADGSTSLVVPEPVSPDPAGLTTAARKVVEALESIARYRALLDLSNPAPSEITGTLKVALARYIEDGVAPRAEPLPPSPGNDLTLPLNPNDANENIYVVQVTNGSKLDLYITVFLLNPDFSIKMFYPDSADQEALKAGATLSVGMPLSGGAPIEIMLPDGWDAARDHVKVIATAAPSRLGWLQQSGENVPASPRDAGPISPLEALLDASLSGTRFTQPAKGKQPEAWTTAELPFTVVRTRQEVAFGPNETVNLSHNITLVTPPGVEGKISITPLATATRAGDGAAETRFPPGLAMSDHFAPLTIPGTRAIGEAGLVFDLALDASARTAITTATPLTLIVPPQPEGTEALVPVIFDGEDYLPAGYSVANDEVYLVAIPMPQNPAGTRDVRRTVRLFLFRKLGHPDEALGLGLRHATLDGNTVRYQPLDRAPVGAGQRVALFVHGFSSKTEWMVKLITPHLATRYDHFLTWDYESYGTSARDTGLALAKALRDAGFDRAAGHTVDLYAHSMGCLVARVAIELGGAHQAVDRLVLAGPPNQGTIMANASGWLIYVTALLLNRASAIPLLGAVGDFLKFAYEQGAGLADLKHDAPLVRELNDLATATGIPCDIMAGQHTPNPAEQARIERLARKLLDRTTATIFGGENDLVISVKSMEGVPAGSYTPLRYHPLASDHFTYFDTDDVSRL